MRMRRRGPGVLGTVARTAVIAGTATHVSNNVSRRQAGRQADKQAEHDAEVQAEAQEMLAQQQQQYAPPPPAPVTAAPAVDFEQIKKLGEMRDAGILTEEELASAKSRLLGI